MGRKAKAPVRNPENRENYLISLAVDETEKRLKNGTASSQIITTLLKLATVKAQLEIEKLRSDISLQEAKRTDIMERASESELYEEALKAFRSYKGDQDEEEYDDEYF